MVEIYTDGACSGNPGPGGYGVVLLCGGKKKELSGGYQTTTNNRMEMMGVIVGLGALKERCQVTLYSDSKYVVDGISKGWAEKWRKNNWMRNKKDKAMNPDLWQMMLDALAQHDVHLVWVKGHADNVHNERCDFLATNHIKEGILHEDTEYIINLK